MKAINIYGISRSEFKGNEMVFDYVETGYYSTKADALKYINSVRKMHNGKWYALGKDRHAFMSYITNDGLTAHLSVERKLLFLNK